MPDFFFLAKLRDCSEIAEEDGVVIKSCLSFEHIGAMIAIQVTLVVVDKVVSTIHMLMLSFNDIHQHGNGSLWRQWRYFLAMSCDNILVAVALKFAGRSTSPAIR